MIGILLAATLLSVSDGDAKLTIDAETKAIDPARSLFLNVTVVSKASARIDPPDLTDRVVGLKAECGADEVQTNGNGFVTEKVEWCLQPNPCEAVYKIRPFAFGNSIGGPIYFDPPPEREPVTGKMELVLEKDLPSLSRLVGYCAAALAALAALVWGVWALLHLLVHKVKEYRMSPIERAWVELDRLLKKGLPGRGRYKDFYVELTMVVRRYVQRKYGIKAPHLTTEEFLHELANTASSIPGLAAGMESLGKFLESADMVKFAGVEATPEMADAATDSARGYLKSDASAPQQEAKA